MRLLLDTHAFLWWTTDDARLSDLAREEIADGRNEVYFSAASGWEIAVKAGLGRVEAPEELGAFVTEQLSKNAFRALPVHLTHALHVRTLPDHHRDPLDRLLVAQSFLENLPILSADPQVTRYPVEIVW